MPAIVIAAFLNALKLSITAILCFTPRWSCSIRLFRYFDERSLVLAGSEPSAFQLTHRTVRCGVTVQRDCRGQRCWLLIALRKNALAAATSRLGLSRSRPSCPPDQRHDTGSATRLGSST